MAQVELSFVCRAYTKPPNSGLRCILWIYCIKAPQPNIFLSIFMWQSLRWTLFSSKEAVSEDQLNNFRLCPVENVTLFWCIFQIKDAQLQNARCVLQIDNAKLAIKWLQAGSRFSDTMLRLPWKGGPFSGPSWHWTPLQHCWAKELPLNSIRTQIKG